MKNNKKKNYNLEILADWYLIREYTIKFILFQIAEINLENYINEFKHEHSDIIYSSYMKINLV